MNKKAYINGKFISSENKIEIISPLDLKVIGSVPALGNEQIDGAFKAAKKAFKNWKSINNEKRIEYVNKFKDLLQNKIDELAKIMNMEIGKKYDESITEINRTIDYINETIEAWKSVSEKTVIAGNKISIQKRVPLGVVLAISPFNYPVNLSIAKIVPALLIGNCVVFKAATNGSLTGAFIAELFSEIGIPNGVFNYVTGKGSVIGDFLTTHKDIDMITFTGGEYVGKGISKNVHMKPIVLELGGNDAAYVRFDANIENAAREISSGAFDFAGQRCTAIKRVILHKKIANEFISLIVRESSKKDIDPLVTTSSANYVNELLRDSLENGGELIMGGNFEKNRFEATIIKTSTKSRAWNEEAFGPLLPITIVGDDIEAIKVMNDSKYGLQNSIFTKDIEWAKVIAPNIESGTVNINSKSSRGPDKFPFLGIKDSGFGVQGIEPALESMSRILNTVVNK